MRSISRSKCGSTDAMSRRRALRSIGVGVAAIPIVGCSSSMATMLADAGPLPGDAAGEADGGSTADDAAVIDGAVIADGWASGGTAAMTAMATYPDPFAGSAGSSCALTAPTTLGPCYFTSPVRRDVSEGYPGLPVRLALRVVDESCAPIESARVEIWHTRNSGLYSGGPVPLCTTNDADALAHLYFRGGQVTDADGQVAFDTCFPGWYPGRAIHIHFHVILDGGARATAVSQLFFAAPLITEIFETHPEYAAFGQPDRPNDADSIYRGVGASGILEHERTSDGAMLAWKQLVVR